ncbi:hypothetical protein QO011_002012 [Labrys wisconsinensis]|uniref:DUF2849 domain-containing protein n=1 Tax=Labrys wisconsinensis TaxID=425677 RepID=A0ABU0J402_9HYPH|nr:hypothetical protein [Labrys wisconsinensis]
MVFRTVAGAWTLALDEAFLAESETAAGPALEAARLDGENNLIVDPYVIEVDGSGPSPRPARLREAIRAFGPTIAYMPQALLQAAE